MEVHWIFESKSLLQPHLPPHSSSFGTRSLNLEVYDNKRGVLFPIMYTRTPRRAKILYLGEKIWNLIGYYNLALERESSIKVLVDKDGKDVTSQIISILTNFRFLDGIHARSRTEPIPQGARGGGREKQVPPPSLENLFLNTFPGNNSILFHFERRELFSLFLR